MKNTRNRMTKEERIQMPFVIAGLVAILALAAFIFTNLSTSTSVYL